jgi:hypothetical protein
MHAQFGNNSGIVTDWRGSARTRVLLAWDASLQFRANVSAHTNELNDVVTRSLQSQFPDFELDYGRIANVIQLSRIFNNPRLRTAYTRSQVNDYRDNTNVPSQISTSSSWQPLLSVDGDFKNQTRLGFKVERRITQRENFQFGHTVATDRNTDINVSLNRSYSRGQKVRILLKETTVRTNISLGLTAVYSKRSGETRQVDIPNSKPQFPANTDRLSINGTGSYSFSSNITGNVSLGFGQTRDLELEIVQRVASSEAALVLGLGRRREAVGRDRSRSAARPRRMRGEATGGRRAGDGRAPSGRASPAPGHPRTTRDGWIAARSGASAALERQAFFDNTCGRCRSSIDRASVRGGRHVVLCAPRRRSPTGSISASRQLPGRTTGFQVAVLRRSPS